MAVSETKIGIYDAKTRLASLVAQVEKGESITITRHGKAVARMVPVKEDEQLKKEKRAKAIEELRTFHKGRFLDGVTIRELIDEGRR